MSKTVDNIAWSNKKIIDTLETYQFAVLLEVLLLPFTLFLETGGLVDHQHLMLRLDFYLRSL